MDYNHVENSISIFADYEQVCIAVAVSGRKAESG